MTARVSLFAVAVVLVSASQASASVISASSQTARSKPADRVDYLTVTTIQSDLNASLREAADATAPTALGSRPAPSNSGGFLLTTEPGSSAGYRDIGGTTMESLFDPDSEKSVSQISRDFANGPLLGAPGSNNRGGRGRGKKEGVHATPEPSTWLLLGAGLTMIGVYEVIRRRG